MAPLTPAPDSGQLGRRQRWEWLSRLRPLAPRRVERSDLLGVLARARRLPTSTALAVAAALRAGLSWRDDALLVDFGDDQTLHAS